MHNEIISKIKDKNIAILGFGKEGQSTYHFIRKYLPEQFLTILDLNDISINMRDPNVEIITGLKYLDNLNNYDLVIKAPGISLKKIKKNLDEQKITSQLELLLEVYRSNIIGITGTKGKSTTASLIYQILKDQGQDVYLLGNIGIPVLEKIEQYKENTILVIEMSSHQLEFIKNSPHIAIILNLFEDHLDHDEDLESYHENKLNIFKYQTSSDIMIYADDNTYLHKYIEKRKYKGKSFDIRFDNTPIKSNSVRLKNDEVYYNNEIIYKDSSRKILGNHNLKNIMFAILVAKLKNLNLKKASQTIKTFTGLKYRMEYICKKDGIIYYNDTIATIPEATISAIETLKNVDTLIFGGMDRGINYDNFCDYLKNSTIKNFICMPTTGYKIGKYLEKNSDKFIVFVSTLSDAYKISKKVTAKGKICLLSPAASSYEYFKNFEEKGQIFENLIKKDNSR